MPAPRLHFAVYGTSTAGTALAEPFAAAGHQVTRVSKLDEAMGANAVLLAVYESQLDGAVAQLAELLEAVSADRAGNRAKPGIVMHSCLGRGVQALDPVEVAGAEVVALAPVHAWQWVATALDYEGAAIATALADETQTRVVMVAEEDRGSVAASQVYAKLTQLVGSEALERLDGALGTNEHEDRPVPSDNELDAEEICDAFAHITDDAFARAFLSVAEIAAQITGDAGVAQWAMRKARR